MGPKYKINKKGATLVMIGHCHERSYAQRDHQCTPLKTPCPVTQEPGRKTA